MNWVVSYTINESNNQHNRKVLWQGNHEFEKLGDARKVFDNISSLEDQYTQTAFPYFGKITRVAIFRLCGRDTFHRRPRFLVDRRDKSEWQINGVEGLINSAHSGMF